jgi:hypothetical protein
MNKKPVFVLALAITAALALTGSVYAENEANQSTAIVIGTTDQNHKELFGQELQPMITPNSKVGLGQLVAFAEPIAKIFVVRSGTVYNRIRDSAQAAGVTTDERIAKTEIFAVEDALAACGLPISAEQYAMVRGLQIDNVDGELLTEAKLLGAIYNDLQPRLESGELKFKTTPNQEQA